jgi:hypothetical protein
MQAALDELSRRLKTSGEAAASSLINVAFWAVEAGDEAKFKKHPMRPSDIDMFAYSRWQWAYVHQHPTIQTETIHELSLQASLQCKYVSIHQY